jgi:hypothetical protein
MATATRSDVELAQRFVEALGAADWVAVEGLLAPHVQLRALVPTNLREEQGPSAVVERFRLWWDGLEDFRLLDSGAEPFADQVRVHYRLAGIDPEDGSQVVEQCCYVTVADGRIAKINSVCSGFQPADAQL